MPQEKNKIATGLPLRGRLLPVLPALLCLVFYWLTLAESIMFGDSGEIAQAVHNWGVIHPTGYPLFTILSKLLSYPLFFFDSIAFRLNVIVSVYAALAVYLFTLSLQSLLDLLVSHDKRHALWHTPIAILGGLAVGLMPQFWDIARLAEVYSLHLVFAMGFLYCFLRFAATNNRRFILYAAIVGGLGLAHHLTIIHFGLAGLVYLLLVDAGFFRSKQFLWAILLSLSPLLFYLYLPLADAYSSGFVWGGTSESVTKFIEHVTAAAYRRFYVLEWEVNRKLFIGLLETIEANLSYLALFAAFGGWMVLLKKSKPAAISLGLFLSLSTLHQITYNTYDQKTFAIPLLFTMALLAFFFFAFGIDFLYRRLPLNATRSVGLFAGGVLLIMTSLLFVRSLGELERYRAEKPFALAMAKEILEVSLADDDILVVNQDTFIFPMIYAREVLNYNPKPAVVIMAFTGARWYERQFRQDWPEIEFKRLPLNLSSFSLKKLAVDFQGKRRIFEHGALDKHIIERAPLKTVNRGLVNEVLVAKDEPPSRYVIESYLSDASPEEPYALPKRHFKPTDRITCFLRWNREAMLQGAKLGHFTWVQPNGMPYLSFAVPVDKPENFVFIRLPKKGRLPRGEWKARMRVNDTLAMEYPFWVE